MDAPSSTVSLFDDIIKQQEAILHRSSESEGARQRLYAIVSRLAKLNLLEDDGRSEGKTEQIWKSILAFLSTHPDYVLYRPSPSSSGDRRKKTRAGGISAEVDAPMVHEEEEEEMGVWLLPRMMRRIAILANGRDAAKAAQSRNDIEDWLASMLSTLGSQFWQAKNDSLAKLRRYTSEMTDVLHALQALEADHSTSYPATVWLFKRGSQPISSQTNGHTHANGVNGAGDPFVDQDKRDKRPFRLRIDNLSQARLLRWSIAKIMLSAACRNSMWTADTLESAMADFVGTEQSWSEMKYTGQEEKDALALNERITLAKSVLAAPASRFPQQLHAEIVEHLLGLLHQRVQSYSSEADLPNNRNSKCEQSLFQATCAIVNRSRYSNDARYATAVRNTVQEMADGVVDCLLSSDGTVCIDVEDNTEELSMLQATCLVVLSATLSPTRMTLNTERPAESRVNHASQLCSDAHRDKLRMWLLKRKGTKLSISHDGSRIGSSSELGALAQAKEQLLSASTFSEHAPNPRKRKHMDAATPILELEEHVPSPQHNARLNELLRTSFNLTSTQGWSAATLEICLKSKLGECEASQGPDFARLLRAAEKAVCMYSQPDDGVAAACSTCSANGSHANASSLPRPLGNTLLSYLNDRPTKVDESPRVTSARLSLYSALLHHASLRDAVDESFSTPAAQSCIAGLTHPDRLVRLAAGKAANALVAAHQQKDSAVSPNGRLSIYFDRLRGIIQTGKLRDKLSAMTAVISLIKCSEDQVLSAALVLFVQALALGGQLKSVVSAQLSSYLRSRSLPPYKLFAPFYEQLCPVIATLLEPGTFSLLYSFAEVTDQSVAALLQTPVVTRLFLSTAVLQRRQDIIALVSEYTETAVAELLLVHADCILAPLYFQTSSKFEECSTFLFAMFEDRQVAQASPYTLRSMLEACLPALLLEISERAATASTSAEELNSIFRRIFRVLDPKTETHLQLAKSGTIMTVFGKAGDLLRGMFGRKTVQERTRLLQAMELLVDRIGAPIHTATPQIMTTLQSCFKDPTIRHPTLLLWQKFLRTLVFDDTRPLLAQTTAAFMQTWPELTMAEKSIVKGILEYYLLENANLLGPDIDKIANLHGISELEHLQQRLSKAKRHQSFNVRLEGYLERLDTVNEVVLVQALRELADFLKQESSRIHRLASGSTFDPILGRAVHALLSSAIRNTEGKSPARSLALQCIGIIGALDPDRVAFPAEEVSFDMHQDLRDSDECIRFALHIIERILVKVLKSTTDPPQQSALYLAIRGLALVCGFHTKTRRSGGFQPGVDSKIRERWNHLPQGVQDMLEPIIATNIVLETTPQAQKDLVYPLYSAKNSYREWLQTWTSDLIEQLPAVSDDSKGGISATAIFVPLRAAVRRGHDLTVAYFILPYLIFYILTSGNVEQTANIRLEIETVLQDQISPQKLSMSQDSRSLCAQAIFELMDHLNTWVRARHVYVARKYRKAQNKDLAMKQVLTPVKRIEHIFKQLPQNSVAEAALNSKSYARALLNYEKVLFEKRSKNKGTVAEVQAYYEHLHHIYAELDEPDGMEGVSTNIISPSIGHQIREHESTGRWTSAQSCWEVQLQLHPEEPDSHLGLLRCLRNLGHYDSLRTHILGLQHKSDAWGEALAPYAIESALIAADTSALRESLLLAKAPCAESAFARVVLAMQGGDQAGIDSAVSEAADLLGSSITNDSKDSYHRFYDSIVNLHILHEMQILFKAGDAGSSTQRRHNKDTLHALTSRLEMTSPSFHTRETILNMRRNAYRIHSVDDVNIGPLWLSTSKIALKASHLQTAYSAILQANQLKADFGFLQSAKLSKANEQLYKALQEVDQGLLAFGIGPNGSVANKVQDPELAAKLSKAVLRSARWMQESGRYDISQVTSRFKQATQLTPQWEAAYYRLGQYTDDLLQSTPAYAPGSKHSKNNEIYLIYLESTVSNFAKGLRFGTKFLYQALPRLVTLWLDLAGQEDISKWEAEQTRSASTEKSSRRRSSTTKEDPSMEVALAVYTRVCLSIRRALDKLPAYQWYSVFPQLISRIGHDNPKVLDYLVAIGSKVITAYPQQAVWTMIGQLHSTVDQRKTRCENVLNHAQTRTAKDQPRDTKLIGTIQLMTSLVRNLLAVSNHPVDNYDSLSLSRHFPGLKALMPCDIIIPFQNSMTISLSSDASQVFTHQAFPDNLVTFHGILDEIEVMTSIAKPRKLVVRGSDGKQYRFLSKPMDDLRKDNRLMEFDSLINRLLKKDAESRKRALHIRTYAVIPMNEKCGLIEWVPDTAGFRGLLVKLYEPLGISVWNEAVRKTYDKIKTQQKNDLPKCGEVFENEILPMFPPVFHEWFLDSFPEPTAWLKARSAYARTAAVMSMVGFVLGLGDRHGENILIDTTNGDIVHVDFNCLFGMGLIYFDIAEKVPFRLTQNIVDGLGITGVEGMYRRSCEITLRILRENRNSLMSVLESFVHDPLLDLQLSKPGSHRKAVGSAKGESKENRAKREEEARKTEARGALSVIQHKLKGTQSTALGNPSDTITSLEMTVENLIKEATDPKHLGAHYVGWSAYL